MFTTSPRHLNIRSILSNTTFIQEVCTNHLSSTNKIFAPTILRFYQANHPFANPSDKPNTLTHYNGSNNSLNPSLCICPSINYQTFSQKPPGVFFRTSYISTAPCLGFYGILYHIQARSTSIR